MIDPNTGVLAFEQPPIQIAPTLTRTQFRATDWAKGATSQTANEPWHSWKLPAEQYRSGGLAFVIVLYFHGERLAMIDFAYNDPAYGKSWADFSMENEIKRKQAHDQWLVPSVGKQRDFPWGTITSEYDDRADGSSIVIRYADQ
jgi:hypothetical protein